ncbi:MAG: aminoacyl-histidine dipeptidase [Deltaproteobacteria bacterium]|nr:aminoacyl-histidine dipeptidase [Deltaproteobacteria bacterium]
MKGIRVSGLLRIAIVCCTFAIAAPAGAGPAGPAGPAGAAGAAGPELPGDDAETKRILSIFQEITQVPRCSKQEGKISAWLVQWARARNLVVRTDSLNNVLIFVPASPGREDRPVVALQAHMDMVCQKTETSVHDFSRDPIPLVRDGQWLRARDTTLGADDGIGMAIALYLAEKPGLERPALELLFTTDEEMDMTGAAGLSRDALTARRFINIDSETEGMVTLGAAGGVKMGIRLPLAFTPLEPGQEAFALRVGGLLGGHSGLEIGKQRANANTLAARAARSLREAVPLRIVRFAGGSADNAITTAAEMVLVAAPAHAAALRDGLASFEGLLRREYPEERDLTLSLVPLAERPGKALSDRDSAKLIGLTLAIPQGVVEWSGQFPGLPETSNNLGIVRTIDSALELVVFHRSFHPAKLERLAREIEGTAVAAGARATVRSTFPVWPPDPDSELYRKALAAYERAIGRPLQTEVLHAGLECGFIAEKYPGMEIISIGPTLESVHTPAERLHVPSLGRIALFLRELLKDL